MSGIPVSQMFADAPIVNPIIGTGKEKRSRLKCIPIKDISAIQQPPKICLSCNDRQVVRKKRGICSRCYSYLYDHKTLENYPEIFPPFSAIDLFNEKIIKTDYCWLWIGLKIKKGYGLFGINRKNVLAHRISWVIANGEIPDELNVLHKCDNPSCVNPDHLFLGTLKDNMQDCARKGRLHFNAPGYKGEQCWQAKLTNADVRVIRERAKSGEYGIINKLAKEYNVHQSTISDAVKGKYYKNI